MHRQTLCLQQQGTDPQLQSDTIPSQQPQARLRSRVHQSAVRSSRMWGGWQTALPLVNFCLWNTTSLTFSPINTQKHGKDLLLLSLLSQVTCSALVFGQTVEGKCVNEHGEDMSDHGFNPLSWESVCCQWISEGWGHMGCIEMACHASQNQEILEKDRACSCLAHWCLLIMPLQHNLCLICLCTSTEKDVTFFPKAQWLIKPV